ncbi:PREDICTED: probable receptor-like protein kinase At5g47070 isoform X2 [Populus euphratica]|uniref:non-specific serine/threonine protein kinase n=1 Tax=Populus euphratica TaxID=75702 RepID=A0AAJ6UKR5_POPEU|nr:PREDICTED: probable receptor-like protein kinase At5g47070 isoform X2 [Populus euphratica]
MKCFHFSNKEKNEEPKTCNQIGSARSTSSTSTSMSTDRDLRKSGSGFNSQNVSDFSTESSTKNSFAALSQRQSNLRVFTFLELKTATKNFSRSVMIGEGGFGGVYRGVIRSMEDSSKKIDIAVKQLGRRGLQGHKEWVTEVNFLGIAEHPNIVKLVGYCAEDDERGVQRLLVYEFMPNKSVQDHLSSKFQNVLPWATRVKIAQDAARGLAYLHEGMDFQVVGTIGYAAPEYIRTGRLTSKSDVWSFGVFLYELITGRRPLDRNRPKNEQKLLEWVRPHLTGARKFRLILDPRLDGKYNIKTAQKLAAVANCCLVRQAKTRPKMSEILEMINKIVDTTDNGSPLLPMKILAPKDAPERSKSKRIKMRFVDPIIGESGCWSAWRTRQ